MTGSYPIRRGAMWAFVALVLVVLFGFGALAVASSGAVAQEQPGDPTEQNDSTPTPAEELTPEEEIEDQLGDLVIHSYDYDGDTERMTIEMSWQGRAPTTVTLTEMIELDSGGSTQISFQRQRLRPDERTEVKIGARQRTGGTAAVLLTTPESVNRGEGLVLQDGDPDEYPSIRFANVVLGMSLTAVASAGVVFVVVVRKKHAEEYGKERIA
jgi:hypothetical protein